MISSATLGLSSHRLPPPPPRSSTPEPNPKSLSEPQARKQKGSPQLYRWSRARSIRSGRKLDRLHQRTTQRLELNPQVQNPKESEKREVSSLTGSDGYDDVEATFGKAIFMVSDGTGWTAEHSVNASLGQFEHCLVDRGCPVNTHLFSGVIMNFHFFFLSFLIDLSFNNFVEFYMATWEMLVYRVQILEMLMLLKWAPLPCSVDSGNKFVCT
jgi:hypothetical protein